MHTSQKEHIVQMICHVLASLVLAHLLGLSFPFSASLYQRKLSTPIFLFPTLQKSKGHPSIIY
jgi:hypothetical protein